MTRERLLASSLSVEAVRAQRWAEQMAAEADAAEAAGLGKRGEELRAVVAHLRAESLACLDAGHDLQRCRKDLIAWRCHRGHTAQHPYTCGRAMLCPTCARAKAADRGLWYWGRAALLSIRTPGSFRPRMLTLPVGIRHTETDGEAYRRLRSAWQTTWRVIFGRPHSKDDWRVYFETWPISERELAATAAVTPAAGRPRSDRTRLREARAARRRSVLQDPRRKMGGSVFAYEWGPHGGNAHVHALVIGRYVHQRTLSRCWKAATGGDYVVDIRLVRSLRGGLREVLKYATKFEELPLERQASIYRETLSVSQREDGTTSARSHRRIELAGRLREQCDKEVQAKERYPTGSVVCPHCGEDMHPYGVIPESYRRMGILDPPEHCLFKR